MATQSTTTVPHTSRGPILIIVSNILLGLNVIFIGLRFYTKARIAKTFNYNDVFMMIAVVRSRGASACLLTVADDSRRLMPAWTLCSSSASRMVLGVIQVLRRLPALEIA